MADDDRVVGSGAVVGITGLGGSDTADGAGTDAAATGGDGTGDGDGDDEGDDRDDGDGACWRRRAALRSASRSEK